MYVKYILIFFCVICLSRTKNSRPITNDALFFFQEHYITENEYKMKNKQNSVGNKMDVPKPNYLGMGAVCLSYFLYFSLVSFRETLGSALVQDMYALTDGEALFYSSINFTHLSETKREKTQQEQKTAKDQHARNKHKRLEEEEEVSIPETRITTSESDETSILNDEDLYAAVDTVDFRDLVLHNSYSFDIQSLFNDNNYLNDAMTSLIENNSSHHKSSDNLAMQLIHDAFDKLMITLVDELKGSTSLQYINTTSNKYLETTSPNCTFI